jgi:hypothetical protein
VVIRCGVYRSTLAFSEKPVFEICSWQGESRGRVFHITDDLASGESVLFSATFFIFLFSVFRFSRGTMSSPKAAQALGIAGVLVVVGKIPDGG